MAKPQVHELILTRIKLCVNSDLPLRTTRSRAAQLTGPGVPGGGDRKADELLRSQGRRQLQVERLERCRSRRRSISGAPQRGGTRSLSAGNSSAPTGTCLYKLLFV